MENLKMIRKNKNMTQQHVASLLGISRSTYTQYETGVSEPSISVINQLSQIFSVPPAFLLETPPFDNFADIMDEISLFYEVMERMIDAPIKKICGFPPGNLDVLITIMASTLHSVKISTSGVGVNFDISPLFPIEEIRDVYKKALAESAVLTADEYRLISHFRLLNEEWRDLVLKQVELAANSLNPGKSRKKISPMNHDSQVK